MWKSSTLTNLRRSYAYKWHLAIGGCQFEHMIVKDLELLLCYNDYNTTEDQETYIDTSYRFSNVFRECSLLTHDWLLLCNNFPKVCYNMFYFEVEGYKAISLKQLSIMEISLAKVILIFIIIIKTTPAKLLHLWNILLRNSCYIWSKPSSRRRCLCRTGISYGLKIMMLRN